MDHGKVFGRAWDNVWHYRALWIFGLILALTTASWGTGLLLDGDDGNDGPRVGMVVTVQPGESFFDALERTARAEYAEAETSINEANLKLDEFFAKEMNVEVASDILTVIAILAGIALTAFILAMLARYIAETALIRMVDEYEETNVRQGFWQGVRLGWSRSAWRLFLIDFVVNTPVALAFLLLFALALSPLLFTIDDRSLTTLFGVVFTAGFMMLLIFLAILVAAALSLFKPAFRRVCVLERQGVFGSVRQGSAVVRQNFKDAGITWLVVVGVNLIWPLFLLPIVVALAGVAIFLGGASALLTAGFANLTLDGAVIWILTAVVGISVFLLTLVVPLAFLGGLREVFISSAWTLTYRELRSWESTEHEELSQLGTPGLEAASIA